MAIKSDSRAAAIKAAEIGVFVTLQKIVPAGSLQARRLKNGTVALYWRYTHEGLTERVQIGRYDSTLPPKQRASKDGGYSFAGAAAAAEALAERHHGARSEGGHRALVASKKAAQIHAAAERAEADKQTLEALVLAYCEYLKSLGRSAHRDARSLFNLHLICASPQVARTPAAQVTPEQVADVMRRVFEAGKGRTANKLRSYLAAAYEVAREARTDPSVPVRFKSFNVRMNPASATKRIKGEDKRDKNPLSTAEMRMYWGTIKTLPGTKGALLRLHLLTGGQRIEQLVRLKASDVADDAITLFDTKGRPGRLPRAHPVPLVPEAAAALRIVNADVAKQAMALDDAEGARNRRIYALSTDGGVTHIGATTLSRWAAEAVGDKIPGFKAKRLRSGVETLLSSAGISKDIRGRLQSHGIGGVQDAHYDAHHYLPDKRVALEALLKLLTTAGATNIVSIKAAA